MRPLASTSNLSYNILPEWTANCTAVELFIMSRLSVCLSVYPFVCLSLGTLAACTLATTGHQRLRTANPSADGRRSTAIFGSNCHRQGDISSRHPLGDLVGMYVTMGRHKTDPPRRKDMDMRLIAYTIS